MLQRFDYASKFFITLLVLYIMHAYNVIHEHVVALHVAYEYNKLGPVLSGLIMQIS